MGKTWLNAMRNVFRSPARAGNDQEEDKKRARRWAFLKNSPPVETNIQHNVTKTKTGDNLESKMDTIAVAMATTVAAEAAIATAQAAVDVIRLSAMPSTVVFREHKAALVIQTVFRGYLARRALMALKGIVELQALIRGHIVRKRAKMTLRCIQSLVRVQTQVCDQRRRRSCEATSTETMFSPANYRRKSMSKNNSGCHLLALEEIQALVQRDKDCSLKLRRMTLGHALSQQNSAMDEYQLSDNNSEDRRTRRDRSLCSNLSVHSPRTPFHSCNQTEERRYQSAETPTSRKIYLHRMSMSESSCPLPQPHYMTATASAIARIRPHSTPRNRLSTTSREQAGHSAKKRLTFPVINPHGEDDEHKTLRYRGVRARQSNDNDLRSGVPDYCTE